MAKLLSSSGREIDPSCTWDDCAFYQLGAGEAAHLCQDNADGVWTILKGEVLVDIGGRERTVSSPQPFRVAKGSHPLVVALEPTILFGCDLPKAEQQHGERGLARRSANASEEHGRDVEAGIRLNEGQ